jgi:hypothetical protein
MSNKAGYYQLKGMVSELTPEQQAEVEQARQEILAIAKRSDLSFIGLCLAGAEIEKLEGSPMQ